MNPIRYGGATPRPHRHRWRIFLNQFGPPVPPRCELCGKFQDETTKRGRNNRKRGGAAELDIARTYGGEKVGPLGLPEDIRGKLFATQVKVTQRAAPPMWLREFSKLDTTTGRTPRLILRFARQGVKAEDFIVVRGKDWLDWFGRDE